MLGRDSKHKTKSNAALKGALAYLFLGSLWILYSDALLIELFGSVTQIAFAQTIKGLFFVLTTALFFYWIMKKEKQVSHKAEALYRGVVEDQTEFIVRWSPDGEITFANNAFCKHFGLNCHKAAGTLFSPFVDKTILEHVHDVLEATSQDHPFTSNELQVKLPDGSTAWTAWTERVFFSGDGQPIEIQSVGRDVTAQKEYEDALKESKGSLQALLDNSPVAISQSDSQGNVIYFNEQFERLFGYTLQDIPTVDEWFEKAYPDEDYRKSLVSFWQDVISNGKHMKDSLFPNEADISCKDGSLRHVEVGRVFYANTLIATFVDLTERRNAEEALRVSEKNLRDLYENMRDGAALADLKGEIFFSNTAFQNMIGYTAEETKHLRYQDITPEKWHGIETEIIKTQTLKRGYSDIYEKEYIRKDGSVIPVELRTYLSTGKDGEPTGFGAFIRDISARKVAELELRQERDRAQKYLDVAGIMFVVLDKTGTISLVNRQAIELLGYTGVDLVGRNWFETCIPPRMRDDVFKTFKELMEGSIEPVEYFENPVITRDGEERLIAWHNTILTDDSGTFSGTLSSGEDITDKKKNQEALLKSEERFSLAMEAANDGIWDLDVQTGEVYFSPRYYTMLGYEPDELPASYQTWINLLHPDDLERSERTVNEVIKHDKESFEIEFRLKTKDNVYKWILSRGKVVERDADGKSVRLTGTHSDISERKRLEDQYFQSQKMETVGRLAGGIAHDFNNLLTVITGNSDMALLNLSPGESLYEDLTEIKNTAERAAQLTRQLLAFSRRQIINPEVVDLNYILLNMEKMLRRLIGENIEYNTFPCKELWPVLIDRGQIEQVLTNLVVNARDAMPNGGKLTIETANFNITEDIQRKHPSITSGEHVMIAVSDNGIGIDKASLDKVFEPFYTTKKKGQGTGLGLSTCYGIIKQSHGDLWIYSEPGQGTTVKIYLPRTEKKVKTAEIEDTPHPSLGGNETILLVEDEDVLRKMIIRILTRNNYTVFEAGNGEEALKMLEQIHEQVTLVVTDVVMPRMGGKELAERIYQTYPGMKIIFMSGYTDQSIVRHGVLEEGVTFIQKPFTPDSMLKKIRDTLD